MFPLSYGLALVALTIPPDPAPVPSQLASFQSIRFTIQSIAVDWELLDPRETRYVLTRDDDYSADLKLLRRRYMELRYAPPLHDSNKFPDRILVNDLLTFNRMYRFNLEQRQQLEAHYWWEIREAIQETDRLYSIWDTVRDSSCTYYYVTVRRQALKKLKETVGFEAYCSGALPPHIPIWRFSRIH